MKNASVLIFAYNRETFLTEAINSVLSQVNNENDVEVIVSTCFQIIEIRDTFNDKKNLKFLEFPKETEYGDQFIKTFDSSSGEVIFILEDDDLFFPWKIGKIIELFNGSDKIVCVKDRIKKFTDIEECPAIIKTLKNRDIEFELFELDNSYRTYKAFSDIGLWAQPSSMAFRRIVIEKNRDIILCSHPMDIMLGIAIINIGGQCAVSNLPLTLYRVHLLNESALFQPVKDKNGYGRIKRTLERYKNGLHCAYTKSHNYPFFSRVMVGEYYTSTMVMAEAVSGKRFLSFFFALFYIVIQFAKETISEVNCTVVKSIEKVKWYTYFAKRITVSVIFSMMIFFRYRKLVLV